MKTHLCLALLVLYSFSLQARVLPTNAIVAGKSLGDWTAEYNRWFFTQPTNQSPALDTDGSRANTGQAGPVFFVAGGFYSGIQPARHYSVPSDKYLLIPLVTIQAENIDTFPPKTVEELRAIAAPLADATELHLSINGVAETNLFAHRAVSPVYSFLLESPDNLFSFFYGHDITGLIDPVVADGYWVMLEPLAPGTYTVVFSATYAPPIDYWYQRTDVITVLPAAPSEPIAALSRSVGESVLPALKKSALRSRLTSARRAFQTNRLADGIFHLSEFQHSSRRWIKDAQISSDFVRRAQHIIDGAVHPVLLPNNTEFEGRTIGDWSAEWWKWQMPISSNSNPMLDTNGMFASVGQPDSSIFLLGGHLGLVPDTFYRSFTVPETKYLFGSPMPYVADNIGVPFPYSEEVLREQARGFINEATNLRVGLNGLEFPDLWDRRAISPVFSIFQTNADNLHSSAYGFPITGLIDPMVCDGYWHLVEPLPVGMHQLNVTGELRSGGYGVHVVNTINVTPVPFAGWLTEFMASIEMSGFTQDTQNRFVNRLSLASHAFAGDDRRGGIAHLRALDHQIRNRLRNDLALEGLTRRVARTMARATREPPIE